VVSLLDDEAEAIAVARDSTDPHSPWNRADGWRHGHPGKRLIALLDGDERIEISARGANGDYRLDNGIAQIEVTHATLSDGWLSAHYDGVCRRHRVFVDGARITLHDGEYRNQFEHAPAFAFVAATSVDTDRVVAPMPGRIVVVKAEPGQDVVEGSELLVMEAMKMELTLRAPRDGRVEAIQTQAGDFVDADAILVRLEPIE
jgi:3-methylcrotonyl-CoA carboxylase alpha subunit